jgi:hypothetical protein
MRSFERGLALTRVGKKPDNSAAGRAEAKQARKANNGSRKAMPQADVQRLVDARRNYLVPADQPLVLICQVQRSGGTLLSRLFDGHPECHVHPFELHIGYPHRFDWPTLKLSGTPSVWFQKLSEERLVELFTRGHRRLPMKGHERERADGGDRRYPMLLPPSLHRRLFLDEIERRAPIASDRQILDAYLTGLFNAWLDNQSLYGADKRWVVAFTPRLAWGKGRRRFFSAYPDGRLISIVRDPRGWLVSTRGREDPEKRGRVKKDALESWVRSVQEAMEAKERFGDQVTIVAFEDLVAATTETMRGLAAWLDIADDRQLSVPTFNRWPVGANSSFVVREAGVMTAALNRYVDQLDHRELELVATHCDDLHREALAMRDIVPGASPVSA